MQVKPETDEFDAVVREHFDAMHAFAWRIAGNRHDAEDIAQQTFFQAFRAWKKFEGRAQVRTWLFRIAIRVAGRVLAERERRPSSLEEHTGKECDPLDVLQRDEEAFSLQRALADLAPIHRLVLTLFTLDGLSHREIAEILECPEGTVWSRLHHAKAALQRRWNAQQEEVER